MSKHTNSEPEVVKKTLLNLPITHSCGRSKTLKSNDIFYKTP